MFRVADRAPPLNWIFARPCSGARRAAWIQQHAQRFAWRIGRPEFLAHEPGTLRERIVARFEENAHYFIFITLIAYLFIRSLRKLVLIYPKMSTVPI
jgi:hypothetical protein